MMRMIITLLLTFILTGCAAIITGTSDKITVQTETKDATIFVNNEAVGRGSATFTLQRKELGETTISVKKDNCQTVTRYVNGTFNPATLLGIFVDWGIISILAVDGVATGAWQKAEQSHYYLNPVCK